MITRQEQAEQTRQKILAAAQQIIREEGIHALSSLKIIETAGISKGGFFHHFPQLEDLYLFMLDQLMQQMSEDLAPKKFRTHRAFIRAASDYTIELLEQAPETMTTLFYFLSQCHHKPAYQARLKAMLNTLFARWANDISHYFKPGLSQAQKDRIIRLHDMYFCGFSFHYLILQDKKLYRSISDDFANMLITLIEVDAS